MKTVNIDKLKISDPQALETYKGLTHQELLEMCCGERLDLLDMNERVAVFMEECTCNMSYTTYTPEVIKGLISAKQEYDLNRYCKDLTQDYNDKQILEDIRERAKQID